MISEHRVERAIPDTLSQLTEGGDFRLFLLGQGFGLGDFVGLEEGMMLFSGSSFNSFEKQKGRGRNCTGKRGVGFGLSRSSSGSHGRSTPPIR